MLFSQIKKRIPLKAKIFISSVIFDLIQPKFSRKSFGVDNPDKKFLVLGNTFSRKNGLLAIVFSVVENILYCLEKNIILVVDLKNNDNQYLDDLDVGVENSWEYFFRQPFGYNLEDIKSSKNVIYLTKASKSCPFSCMNKFRYFSIGSFDKKNTLFCEYKIAFNKYIRFNDFTENFINTEYERIFEGKERVLGVLARGTDYLLNKPKYHRIQPEPDVILEKSKQIMQDQNCSYIYLATEDDNMYQLFRDCFGEKLLVNSQKRVNLNNVQLDANQLLNTVNFGRERDKYNLGLEYLSSLYNLSRCQCFVGGVTAGTAGVFAMTKGFEYHYLFDLGCYK